jgi:hypothetical protein
MTEMTRYCPDCGRDTAFEQPHAGPGSCPDWPDGECPEWCCIECGAALLTAFGPAMLEPAAQSWRRVA